MKTTIYELLGMIKDDILIKRILYRNGVYEYDEDGKDFYNEEDGWIFDEYDLISILNDPVEILETTITYKQEDYYQYQPYTGEVEIKCNSAKNLLESGKIEKLEIVQEKNCKNNWKWKLNGYNISTPQKIMGDKINEIIERVNKL